MSQAATESRKKNRTVIDQHGQCYELTGRIGDGGQGVVCTTNYQNVLIKIGDPKPVRTLEEKQEKLEIWQGKIQRLMRQPLRDLPIAYPLAMIVKPQPGYVMELMDGLMSMSDLLQESIEAYMSDEGIAGYVRTGSVQRRLRILARLARILAELHGRGLAYGDLSPANVFVSQSLEYAEVWLIDADNISSQSRDSQQGVFTPDYGAPEILRGESGINTLTDSWSFAVLAYRFLTLAHPLKGDHVLEGEPEIEEAAALRGELPWVDHSTDRSNALTLGLPRDMVLNAPLRKIFEQCFNTGLHDPGHRPSLSEWADVFAEATGHCTQCASCNSTFFYTKKLECPFCEHIQNKEAVLLLSEYRYMPLALLREGLSDDIPELLIQKECWSSTGKAMILSSKIPVLLKSLPMEASLYAQASLLCTLELDEDGLWIDPAKNIHVFLQRAADYKVVEVQGKKRLKSTSHSETSFWLHLGPVEEEHVVWRFVW